MSRNIDFKGDLITLDSLHGTNIMGTLYLNNINVNTVIENAPPNLDEIKEIAANLISVPTLYFNKVTNATQNVTGDVKFNNVAESSSVSTGSVVLQGGMGVAKNLNVGGDINVNNNLVINGNTSIRGNLNIEGDTVYANVVNLKVEDKLITLNSNGAFPATGCGIEFEEANVIVGNILMNSGRNGYVMTAPSAINGSATIPIEPSLQTVAIMNKSSSIQKIETGGLAISTLKSVGVVHNDINGNLSTSLITTNDLTDANVTADKLAANAVTTAKIANGNVTFAKLADLSSANFILGNVSNRPAAVSMSGDATLDNTGALTINGSAVTTSKIANGNVTLDKLEGLTSANFILGNVSNRPAAVSMSGDATLDNTGALTINGSAVTTSKIANGNVTPPKMNLFINEDPISLAGAGVAGQIQFNGNALYVCVASGGANSAQWRTITFDNLSV